LKTFLGRIEGDAVGEGAALAKLRMLLLTSESLPTVGRFDDVTEVSELRRGRVTAVVVVVDAGLDAGLRRMDFGCCGDCCCRWL
jgi:hypothetical protein